MKDFHDTKRLQRHLNAVERCCRALQHGDCAGDGPFVKGVEHAWLVPRRVEGPRPFCATLNPERDESPDVELGGMNAATLCARLQGYCIPNKFPSGKAVQLLMVVHRLYSSFGNMDPTKVFLEETPLRNCTACIVLDVIEAYERIISQEAGSYQGCRWGFAWRIISERSTAFLEERVY